MKKTALLVFMGVLLFSCGKTKKEVDETQVTKESLRTTLILDAIYVKDDSIKVFYKVNSYFNYDQPVTVKITGSDSIQKIKIEMPLDIPVENFSIVASTNKDQNTLLIKNISVEQNNNLIFDGSEYKYNDYFLTDESFSWDDKNQRFNINHSNKFPPGIVGNEKFEGLMIK